MAEETHWMRLRLIEPWLPFTMTAVFLVFVIPFFGLMSRAAKLFLPTFVLFALCALVGLWVVRYVEVYPSLHWEGEHAPFGLWEIGVTLGYAGVWGLCYAAFMNAFPRMRVLLMTSPYRDEVQVPVNAETMEPLPAHE
jgi:NhaP-type Na+/H+ or K+/H+ antiporter